MHGDVASDVTSASIYREVPQQQALAGACKEVELLLSHIATLALCTQALSSIAPSLLWKQTCEIDKQLSALQCCVEYSIYYVRAMHFGMYTSNALKTSAASTHFLYTFDSAQHYEKHLLSLQGACNLTQGLEDWICAQICQSVACYCYSCVYAVGWVQRA
jgi:hypothetical protein